MLNLAFQALHALLVALESTFDHILESLRLVLHLHAQLGLRAFNLLRCYLAHTFFHQRIVKLKSLHRCRFWLLLLRLRWLLRVGNL